VLACALLLTAIPTLADEHQPDVVCATDWDYGTDNGPNRWGQLQPAYEACDAVPLQSPVTLGNTGTANPVLTLSYSTSPIVLQTTAHAINVFTLGANNTLRYGSAVNARLTKFHFHVPAEHAPAGAAKGELHLVHFQGNAGYVVAIFIDDDGTDNTAIGELLMRKPPTACTSVRIASFPMMALRPSTSHWTMYMGSLTTPPCSGGVTFFVMKEHMHISPEQFAALRQLSEGARDLQLTNGRSFLVH
jgi:carbonic anhydrase